jgi:shikimate dehydrogenase
MRAVVIGAGGAGISVTAAMLAGGAEVTVLNRTLERLRRALERLRQLPVMTGNQAPLLAGWSFDDPESSAAVAGADLLVNCVPPQHGAPPLELTAVSSAALACDLTYTPAVTPFLRRLGDSVAHTWNGLGMLLYQGAASFTLWTGCEAPIAVMAGTIGYRLP